MLPPITEAELQADIVETAGLLGYAVYHTHDSRHSARGFPDLVLVRDRVVYVELKREKGFATPEQREWLRALAAAGAEAYVVRPRNREALTEALRARGAVPRGAADELAGELRAELARGG